MLVIVIYKAENLKIPIFCKDVETLESLEQKKSIIVLASVADSLLFIVDNDRPRLGSLAYFEDTSKIKIKIKVQVKRLAFADFKASKAFVHFHPHH